jgi:hypothetical protein
MEFELKIGAAAKDAVNQEKPKRSEHQISSFKSGTTYKVRIPNASTFAYYQAHGVFVQGGGGIPTSACTVDDLYCQASRFYYEKSNLVEDEKEKKDLQDKGYQLKAKDKVLLGFFDLGNGGKETIIELTKKQGKQIIATIEKQAKRLGDYGFELSKSGSGQETVVALDIILDDLEGKEAEAFTATAGKEFNLGMFGEVVNTHDRAFQIEKLRGYGCQDFIATLSSDKPEAESENKEQTFDF